MRMNELLSVVHGMADFCLRTWSSNQLLRSHNDSCAGVAAYEKLNSAKKGPWTSVWAVEGIEQTQVDTVDSIPSAY